MLNIVHKIVLVFIYVFFYSVAVENDGLQEIFTTIYCNRIWDWEETRSGPAASLSYTEQLRLKLKNLFVKYNIRSVLDLGCGDFNWMKHVVSDDMSYIGMDIVGELIEDNQLKYASSNISFIQGDCSKDELPQVDLIMCRDVLAHLSYDLSKKILHNCVKSGSTYILLTNYESSCRYNKNLSDAEIGIGNYCINITKDPFFITCILESMDESIPYPFFRLVPDKRLCLIKIADLALLKPSVTYLDDRLWGGRFGDKLLMYIKAKWIAEKYNLQFFYKPFIYSDLLALHDCDMQWDDSIKKNFTEHRDPYSNVEHSKTVSVDCENFVDLNKPVLHTIHYYFQLTDWGMQQALYDTQEVGDWKGLYDDELFRKKLRNLIKPTAPIHYIEIPDNRTSIAVHVRKGGGYDNGLLSLQTQDDQGSTSLPCVCANESREYMDVGYRLKFPPDQYYIDQIRKLSEELHDDPLYVHIFTDDQNPLALTAKYEKFVSKKNIIFGCRSKDNKHDRYVIDDLFNMIRFDYLIRSGSNFPQVAQLIGNFKKVIYPRAASWRNVLHIHDVGNIDY